MILALSQSDVRIFTRKYLQACLGVPRTGSFREKNEKNFVYSYGNARLLFTFLKACSRSGHISAASASPRTSTETVAMSPSFLFRCSWRSVWCQILGVCGISCRCFKRHSWLTQFEAFYQPVGTVVQIQPMNHLLQYRSRSRRSYGSHRQHQLDFTRSGIGLSCRADHTDHELHYLYYLYCCSGNRSYRSYKSYRSYRSYRSSV